jgi:hypothetical protein
MALRSGLTTGQVSLEPSPEQMRFARVIEVGTWLSVVALVVAFGLYLGGIATPYVPIDRLPEYWGLHAQEFVQQARVPRGWGWVRLMRYGDFMNFVGVAMLAGLPVVGYLAILPLYLRRRDVAYTGLTLAAIALLIVAATI